MPGRVFLIQWDTASAAVRAAQLRAAGWEVETESEDGGRAYAGVRVNLPDVVVVDLARKPSHGRITAAALRGAKQFRELAIIFVDGEGEQLAKTRTAIPDGVFVRSEALIQLLGTLLE